MPSLGRGRPTGEHASSSAWLRPGPLALTRRRTDRGRAATTALGRLSHLSVWWIRLGIEPELTEPASPAQNGRHERIDKTLKAETARPPAG
jgi:hypothetical protein